MTTRKPTEEKRKRIVKPRWFYLGHINCDCASYDHAWLRAFHSGEWPHCVLCKKKLGDMEIQWRGRFKATTIGEAWEQWEQANFARKLFSQREGEG